MFCKYCGKSIDEGTMRCRICGRPVGPLEGGNGFWDLKTGRREEIPVPEKTGESAPASVPAPEAKPEAEPVPTPVPAASAEGIPTAASASPADNKAIRELRSSVKKLQEQVRELTPQRRGAVTGGAILLALLALALGVFVLFQLRTLTGKVQELELQMARITAMSGQNAKADGQGGEQAEDQNGGESKWLGFDQLDGVRLFSRQELFEGPNKGKDDPRGQSINLGLPENGFEETPIFTARFTGPAGTYRYCWVKVETNDATKETYFTPLKEEDGYFFRIPNASDTNKTFVLSIMGEVKEEHLGRYAFVALDTQTLSAYVSAIVELYDRSEQGAAPWNGGDGLAQEYGAGNGN